MRAVYDDARRLLDRHVHSGDHVVVL